MLSDLGRGALDAVFIGHVHDHRDALVAKLTYIGTCTRHGRSKQTTHGRWERRRERTREREAEKGRGKGEGEMSRGYM